PASGVAVALAGVGGAGSEPRRLREPRGVAVLASGAIAVSDTGNHRVQGFLPPTQTLLAVWGSTGPLGEPRPGPGPLEVRRPWAVAAGARGSLYVVDRGNRRVQHIRGDGSWAGAIGADILKDPTRIAVAPGGDLAVVDLGRGAVVVFRPGSPGAPLDRPS